MAIQVQHRRGTAAAHAGFVGAPGEITATTDTKRLILHDGATVGGIPVARLDEVSSEVMRPVGNANFSFLTTDRLVVPTTAYTAPRTGTLPAANAVSAGRTITFFDTLPAINGANTLTIARAGTDTINGATSLVCSAPGGRWDMVSDGVSRWSVTASFTDGDRGDATVSGGGSSITVKNKAITLAKQADVDSGVIMGRDSLLAGSQESLTPARARAVMGITGWNRPWSHIINGDGRVNQRAASGVSDDTYGFDRHYALTQTGAVAISTITAVASGIGAMMRLTQSQAAAQRMGQAQILSNETTRELRGQMVTLGGTMRCSAAATIRFAILEWTGTANSVTSDVVNDWNSSTYTTGNFFISSNLAVRQVGTKVLTADTLTDWSLEATIGTSVNNLIVVYWTEATAAQSVTLDMRWGLVTGVLTSGTAFQFRDGAIERQMCTFFYFRRPASWNGYGTGGVTAYFEIPLAPYAMVKIPVAGYLGPSFSNASTLVIVDSQATQATYSIIHATTGMGGVSFTGIWDAEL